MFAQPGGQILVMVVAILIENDDDGPNFAREAIGLANVDRLLMPVADGFANIDAVQNRGAERFDAHAFFGQDRLGFLLEETAVLFDDQILGRIRANSVAGSLLRPLAREFLALSRFQAGRFQALFGAGKPAAD